MALHPIFFNLYKRRSQISLVTAAPSAPASWTYKYQNKTDRDTGFRPGKPLLQPAGNSVRKSNQ